MPRQVTEMSQEEWKAFLQQERTAVLASSGAEGFPHLVAMWYVPEQDGLLMWTYAKSQKVHNLRRDPRISALVEAGERYEELRGVLVRGSAEIVEDFERVLEGGVALHRRYSETPSNDGVSGVRAQAAKRVLIFLPYSRVVSWDHRKLPQ